MLNETAYQLFESLASNHAWVKTARVIVHEIAGCRVIDAGIETRGSLSAGLLLARLCLGDRAEVSLSPADPETCVSSNAVYVYTDDPLRACLGAQYAGWPIQTENYFAMGSGPMRMCRGREEMLLQLGLSESGPYAVGVLESDRIPDEAVIRLIAKDCNVDPQGVGLAVAPSTSIAGSVQVVARSVETALHKLHALKFDVQTVIAATGVSPLPPPAKPGDTVAGIGRTNDAMLYGATVALWVDTEDDQIRAVAARVPSSSSADHGRPFAKIFKQYDYDFYQVDPLLFSPAVVTIHNLRSGRTWTHGRMDTDVLRASFLQ